VFWFDSEVHVVYFDYKQGKILPSVKFCRKVKN